MTNTASLYKITLALLIGLTLAACGSNLNHSKLGDQANKPLNIILMVGDGMGLAQLSAVAQTEGTLFIESADAIGLIKTTSAAEQITDSAAGATAFSTGIKTYNGAIAVDPDGKPVETIIETLAKSGYATGAIATSTITHATPASFYAHASSRKNYYEIAADMLDSSLSLFIGGGRDHFADRSKEEHGTPDERNILAELSSKGVTIVDSLAELEGASGRVGMFIADGQPAPAMMGRGDILSKAIQPAISHLQKESEAGFFLLVEGSQIDWGGHQNSFEYMATELLDFDKAVAEAVGFALQDGNTLVIVTADHETGGLTMVAAGESEKSDMPSYEAAAPSFSTKGHTSVMVPVYAFGKGAEAFIGVYENTGIYDRMMKAL